MKPPANCLKLHPPPALPLSIPRTKHRLRLLQQACNTRFSHSQPTSAHQHQRTGANPPPPVPQSIISNQINQNSKNLRSLSTPEETLYSLHNPIIIQTTTTPSSASLSQPSTSNTTSLHPVLPSTPTSSTQNKPSASQSKPTPNRRPTKQVINLTPKAIEHLSALLLGPNPRLIRIGVKNKGCAGMAYNLEYVEQAGKFDEVVTTQNEQDPNIKEECGCGESFLV